MNTNFPNIRRSLSLSLPAALCCLLLSAAVLAQPPAAKTQTPPGDKKQKPQPGAPAQEQEQTTQSITTLVRLPVTVTEKSGRFVTTLKKEDFEIQEDKTKQIIDSFKAQSDLPLDIAVLMDTSNSVRPKLKFEKDSAISFLETVLQQRIDRALFVTFDSSVEMHQDFTNQLDLLSKSIMKVKAQGDTRLYDAVYRVCEEKMFAQVGRRRAMVVISDGEDTSSEKSLTEAIRIAQQSETAIFVISTKSGGFFGVQAGTVDDVEDKALKQLSEDTGGRAFFANTVLELERNFSAIARELRSQYLITYIPSNDNYNGKFRKIDVRLPGQKDLRIRARDGYEARPPNQRLGLKPDSQN
ncbi:MAG: VWA domain-containing protein [Blastocatellia bacterium]